MANVYETPLPIAQLSAEEEKDATNNQKQGHGVKVYDRLYVCQSSEPKEGNANTYDRLNVCPEQPNNPCEILRPPSYAPIETNYNTNEKVNLFIFGKNNLPFL